VQGCKGDKMKNHLKEGLFFLRKEGLQEGLQKG
jgi:hypothetical protein